MARWQDVVDAEPDFAALVRDRFDAFRHKTLATLRRAGGPRISGIEATFHDGDLWLGMMPGSRKAQDLRRDARLALHSGSADPPEGDESSWAGDAKVSGRAEEITDPAELQRVLRAMSESQEQVESESESQSETSAHVFRVDLADVVLTRVGDPPDHLRIQTWRPGEPLRSVKRT